MLNYYYWYAAIWSLVIFLYNLGWSDINIPMPSSIWAFFIVTIALSLVLGYLSRKKLVYQKSQKRPRYSWLIITTFVIGFALDFYYGKQIPLFSILLVSSNYTDFTGIPTFHTILTTLSMFYSIYIFYIFLSFPKIKKYLWQYLLILFIFLLMFNRGGMIIEIFMAVVLLLSNYKTIIQKKIKIKHIVAFVLFVALTLYVFGVLGNLRSNYAWNDNQFISRIGEYNNNYPDWLPKQFMWAYSYITTPLANLCYNVENLNRVHNVSKFIVTLIPDFISKRIFPESLTSINIKLVSPVFNASAGYTGSFISAGLVGMYIMYFYMMFIFKLVRTISKRHINYWVPAITFSSMMVVFFFFANTITFSAIGFPLFYPFILSIFSQKYTKRIDIVDYGINHAKN